MAIGSAGCCAIASSGSKWPSAPARWARRLVPLSTWSTRNELEFLLADSAIKLLVSHARFGDRDYAADLNALTPEVAQGGRSARFPDLAEIVLLGADAAAPFARYEDFVQPADIGDDLPPGAAACWRGRRRADPLHLGVERKSEGRAAQAFRRHRERLQHRRANGVAGQMIGFCSPQPLFWSYGSANALSATLTHGGTLVLQERF